METAVMSKLLIVWAYLTNVNRYLTLKAMLLERRMALSHRDEWVESHKQ
jgi:hypothetical protein